MKWEDLTPARVPDEENFFAAPVFETFIASNTPGFSEYSPDAKAHQAAQAMPHARFLHMRAPTLKMCKGIVPESTTAPGLKTLTFPHGPANNKRAANHPPQAHPMPLGYMPPCRMMPRYADSSKHFPAHSLPSCLRLLTAWLFS